MALLDALKTNIGTKQLSVVLDVDGKEIQAEVREDEEQQVKLDEIIDLLFAAGYFRARIKGLSSFDKVVGGMTWCIDSCDVNIDVDLLFKEDLNIGQRLSLSEKIVGVLPKIHCPHRIEPHQIHGLDFIHIYPVIQWLVKHSIERRRETEQYNRSYAVRLYEKSLVANKSNKINDDKDITAESLISNDKILKNIINIQDKYRPQRRFRRTGPLPPEPSARVASTLFEYGLTDYVIPSFSSGDMQTGSDTDQLQAKPQQELQDTVKVSPSHEDIASSMTALTHLSVQDNETRLAAGVVGSIVSMQADEIAEAVQRYSQLQAESEASTSIQLSQLRKKCEQLEDDKQLLEMKLENKIQNLQQLQQTSLVNDGNIESPSRLSEAEQGVLKKLQSLVSMSEHLKQQELLFREQCKTELAVLQNLVREAEDAESVDVEGTTGNDTFILERLNERVAAERLTLGRKTRAVVALQRQLDQIPTRTELAQYQRRFMELYSQVAGKHRETKQFYSSYNILNNKHQYLNKELNILNSIQDNYSQAMSSQSGKEQFMQQLDQIVDGMKQNKKKVEDVRNEERRNRDRLSAQLLTLVDQQRQYVAALKQLMTECHNEVATRSHSAALQL
ncbi:coiled-coil domain-containing protein 93 [Lycorma delicatula]|uniref:coiled-coil domain-containing protein 93 n=1 Tax=Lycorma delicatula TaxID=130591 RepID=UPI003F512B49